MGYLYSFGVLKYINIIILLSLIVYHAYHFAYANNSTTNKVCLKDKQKAIQSQA